MTTLRAAFLALAVFAAADILPTLASTSVTVAEPYEVNANQTQVPINTRAAWSRLAIHENL